MDLHANRAGYRQRVDWMAPLRMVRGSLQYTSEYLIPKKGEYTKWDFWRIEDENGQDVSLENVRALAFMKSHVAVDVDATYVFTTDAWPVLIGIRYPDGRIANGWDEWKQDRMKPVYGFWFGLLLLLPIPLYAHSNWSQTAGYWVFFITIFAILFLFYGFFGCLNNLLSRKPTKQQVETALQG